MKKMVSWGGDTDPGKIRTNNEDSFIVQDIWDQEHVLAVVIDGVGGYEGGEVAAAIAKRSIVEYLSRYGNGERIELLKQAVVYANNRIFEEREKQPQYNNMSCVLTAILVEVGQRRINMAHIGDTRLYQYLDGALQKLSHDHSLVGYREEIGDLTEEEAMHHPQRNVIGRDVGSKKLEAGDTDYVETAVFPLKATSILLLCSDGLCDMLTSVQMKEVLERGISLQDKVLELIQAANDAGGKDNVTVVLVENYFADDKDIPAIPSSKKDSETQTIISGLLKKENHPHAVSHFKWRMKTIVLVSFIAIVLGFMVGYGISRWRGPCGRQTEEAVSSPQKSGNTASTESDVRTTVPQNSQSRDSCGENANLK